MTSPRTWRDPNGVLVRLGWVILAGLVGCDHQSLEVRDQDLRAVDTELQQFTRGPWADRFASYAPDGSRMVFVSDRDGGSRLWIMLAVGEEITPLTDAFEHLGFPVWSPDGKKIVYAANLPDGNIFSFKIFVMNADGSNQTQITNNPISSDTNPSWSPDGNQIVFSSTEEWGMNKIYVIDSNGANITLLTTDQNAIAENPSWSPDGTKISFSSDMGGQQYGINIYIMDSDGANITRITTEEVEN